MSTVCDYATCPECGFDDALYEMDLARRAEMLFCPRCGFDWRFITIIDGQSLASYTIANDSELLVTGNDPNFTFTATTAGGAEDNPAKTSELTAQQENRSVLLTLTNTSSFTLKMGTTAGNNGRNIMFAGEAVFSDPTTIVVAGPIIPPVVVAVPEPSSAALLGLGGLALILRHRRV